MWVSKMKKIATAVSYIFDGSYISIPVFIIICLQVVDNLGLAIGWAVLCLLFVSIIPFMYIFLLYHKKKIYDLHLPNRENRIKPLVVTIISYVMGFFILYVLDAPVFLRSIFAVSIVTMLILTTITYFWKISFHTSWITVVSITFFILFGGWMLLLLVLIPFIGWARVRIKRHTIPQVILGSIISAISSLFIYSSYGFF